MPVIYVMIGIAQEDEIDVLIREKGIIELPPDHVDVRITSVCHIPRQVFHFCVRNLNCIDLSLRADGVREEKGKISVARTDVGYIITLF